MQVQKSEIRNKIINAAISQFCENGYKGASMRTIAKIAGITPGNIYAYFENKNDILCFILDDCVERLNDYILHLHENQIYSPDLLKSISDAITDLFLENKAEFLILFGNAQGSKYENVRSEIIKAVAKRIHSGFTLHSKYSHDILLSEAVATAFIEGIIKIMLASKDDEERLRSLLDDFTQIIFTINFDTTGE